MHNFSPSENQTQIVTNFHDLMATPFHGHINAFGWERELKGNFEEIVQKVEVSGNMVELEPWQLLEMELSAEGQLAREILLEDLKCLEEQGAAPVLNVINFYHRDDTFPPFPTDVYSFHVDRSPIAGATILCTYFGASSEIVPNDQAIQKILVPEIREELKKLHDGSEEDFEDFLKENFFDLHYQTLPNSQLKTLGIGHIWRLAIDQTESEVLPCIHRAPLEKKGEKRLLLIC